MNATPRSLGFRMPAEWEPQEAVWLAWPTNSETWPGPLLDAVRGAYRTVIRELATDQKVHVLVDHADRAARIRDDLAAEGAPPDAVRFLGVPTVDSWIRDYGPTFVRNDVEHRIAMVDWTFNAWGDKYGDLKSYDTVPASMNTFLNLDVFNPGIVMEGGSIEVNGRGTVLTTEQCLLNRNRNPGMSRAEIEAALGEYLNVSNVLWIAEGIVGDDTDGHIDDIARFVTPGTVLAAFEDDPTDDNYVLLNDSYERLTAATDERGDPLDIRKLPMPEPIIGPNGRLPASYANFYIGNRSVIVPVFGQGNRDRAALEVIRSAFPSHRVVGVDCAAMVHGMGAVHCCSQQQPAR